MTDEEEDSSLILNQDGSFTLVVERVQRDYGSWRGVAERVQGVNRWTAQSTEWRHGRTTAKVHLIVNDRRATTVRGFTACNNLYSVSLPYVTTCGLGAFYSCRHLRHVVLNPKFAKDDNNASTSSFAHCLILEVLSASTNFHEDRSTCTEHIIKYLQWRRQMDENKEIFKTTMALLDLCNKLNTEQLPRATTTDPAMGLLLRLGSDLSMHILSFALGEKRGKGDLREATISTLKDAALDARTLKLCNNCLNKKTFGVTV
eukprot:CAMPEP_0118641424 /NCGR_PEP_ID=MMETSP0785-20121206/5275_1 /TAXON_ID=91992 /ORGANISM="Bolidomonas pacifica, Strain CCMP 1866" /LENGTH=258 /DNA_ID=CAMNT_0006532869 /DNA_START=141 /DNA_END=914 /DNA_ORIENTATION=-